MGQVHLPSAGLIRLVVPDSRVQLSGTQVRGCTCVPVPALFLKGRYAGTQVHLLSEGQNGHRLMGVGHEAP